MFHSNRRSPNKPLQLTVGSLVLLMFLGLWWVLISIRAVYLRKLSEATQSKGLSDVFGKSPPQLNFSR